MHEVKKRLCARLYAGQLQASSGDDTGKAQVRQGRTELSEMRPMLAGKSAKAKMQQTLRLRLSAEAEDRQVASWTSHKPTHMQ